MKETIKKLFKIGEYQKEKIDPQYLAVREKFNELGLTYGMDVFAQIMDKLYINDVKFKPSVNRYWTSYRCYESNYDRYESLNEIVILVDEKNTKENYNLKYVLPDIKIINDKYKYHIPTFSSIYSFQESSIGEFMVIYKISDNVLNLNFNLIIKSRSSHGCVRMKKNK